LFVENPILIDSLEGPLFHLLSNEEGCATLTTQAMQIQKKNVSEDSLLGKSISLQQQISLLAIVVVEVLLLLAINLQVWVLQDTIVVDAHISSSLDN